MKLEKLSTHAKFDDLLDRLRLQKRGTGKIFQHYTFLSNFGQKSNISNRNFGPRFWPKLNMLVKNQNFRQKSKF